MEPDPESPMIRRSKVSNHFDLDIKIVDFGIFGSTSGLNAEKVTAGSFKYMAPELLLGHIQSAPAIDIWSLGVILYALVVGDFPFHQKNREDLKKAILNQDISFPPVTTKSS